MWFDITRTQDTILIVDDEPSVLSSIRRALVDEPFTVLSAESAAEGMELVRNNKVKVIISDERMPGVSGAEFLSMVRREFPDIIRIILTGYASISAAMKAINEGEIYRFLTKPWNEIELKLVIKSAVEKYDLENENRRLLRVIKKQALDMKIIERSFPGITHLERDSSGRLILPDVSDSEMESIIEECERELIDIDKRDGF